MTVKSIKFVEEVDNEPAYFSQHGELEQGDTWENYRIYKLVNDDGSEQFIRIGIVHNSYGSEEGVGEVVLTEKATKTVTVWA